LVVDMVRMPLLVEMVVLQAVLVLMVRQSQTLQQQQQVAKALWVDGL
jgi:hypothetical protein